MNGLKKLYLKRELIIFVDSISFMHYYLRKLLETFGLTTSKPWYPNYINSTENVHYVREIPQVSYYGVDAISASESFSTNMRVKILKYLITSRS